MTNNPTVKSFEYGWEHGYRQAKDGVLSETPVKVPDDVRETGNVQEYNNGYLEGVRFATRGWTRHGGAAAPRRMRR